MPHTVYAHTANAAPRCVSVTTTSTVGQVVPGERAIVQRRIHRQARVATVVAGKRGFLAERRHFDECGPRLPAPELHRVATFEHTTARKRESCDLVVEAVVDVFREPLDRNWLTVVLEVPTTVLRRGAHALAHASWRRHVELHEIRRAVM